ncbi:hypothetical protein FGO68_gene1065 [Halteria grandinella]|uniref:Uncharacterized protein n=1 Tax=Halteria grandinella TaxID=5974 RepID=A0A8J8NTR5_HALGN|nr:hypothetical protein FGO68_gene1065 [Halteria grandinella]
MPETICSQQCTTLSLELLAFPKLIRLHSMSSDILYHHHLLILAQNDIQMSSISDSSEELIMGRNMSNRDHIEQVLKSSFRSIQSRQRFILWIRQCLRA